MILPTHEPWRTEGDRNDAKAINAHFWIDGKGTDLTMAEAQTILIGADSDYGGVAFHLGDEITFTVDESDLLEAIAAALRS